MLQIKVKIPDLSAATAAMRNMRAGPLRDGIIQAAHLYLGFTRQRFLKAARGDGTWKPLAASTIARRRKGRRRGGSPEILRDTGILFNSLSAGAHGSVIRDIPNGVEVGTQIKYAKHHQRPTVPGRPPVRKILVPPDDVTRRRMRDAIAAGMIRAVNQIKRKTG